MSATKRLIKEQDKEVKQWTDKRFNDEKKLNETWVNGKINEKVLSVAWIDERIENKVHELLKKFMASNVIQNKENK